MSDADNGRLLCVMDSIEITILRTGAATAVAAKYLSRPNASVVTVFGCGNQGKISIRMLSRVRRLKMVYVYDVDRSAADRLVTELQLQLDFPVVAVDDPSHVLNDSDIVVTCTPSKKAFLGRENIRPGTFIAAVGADSETKQELEPSLLRSSKVVADVIEQSATIGDLHHAIEKGLMQRHDVFAELGEIICGKKSFDPHNDGTVIFDSTGMALQDVAAASIVHKKAVNLNLGVSLNFNE